MPSICNEEQIVLECLSHFVLPKILIQINRKFENKNAFHLIHSEMHFVRLLDDKRFEFMSTYPLDASEYACSIVSCSNKNVYYCFGTAYVLPEENEPTKV